MPAFSGPIQSATVRIPLFRQQADVPEGVALWGLESETAPVLTRKAIESAMATFSVQQEQLKVFSSGREGNAFVVSLGYQL